MLFTLAASSLLAALSVSAQSATHTVMVGFNSTLTYNPSNITASPGDVVTFVFTSKNHTATQSTFPAPCTQLTNTSVTPNVVGISSGFMPVAANASEFPTWSFSVTDTTPLWFFCLQANHCQQGMVFSINATPEKTFDAFQTAAKQTNQSVPNPQTLGAATTPNQNGTANGPDTGAPSTSSTPSTPNGSPSVSGSGTGASPSPSNGAALGLKAPSLAMGVLAVVLGVSL
jgi:plastocyanin